MNFPEHHTPISLGEDRCRHFKVDIRNAESLASEMTAFANSAGGTILIGVGDERLLPGLGRENVDRINQLISNTASQLVPSPLTILRRPAMAARGRATAETSGKASGKTSGKILAAIRQDTGQLRRIGPAKGGYWEIVE